MKFPFSKIPVPYMLLSLLPHYVDAKGDFWTDQLWELDLWRHTQYLEDLTIVAEVLPHDASITNLARVRRHPKHRLRISGLKSQGTYLAAIVGLPFNVWKVFSEVRKASVVHSGVIGWPFPLSWVANSCALFLNKALVLNIESAPWRRTRSDFLGPQLSRIHERCASYFMNRADLAIATQPSYLTTLRTAPVRGSSFVNPATWINEANLIDPAVAERTWDTKEKESVPRFLFASRLLKEKGVEILLATIDELELRDVKVQIDLIGSGSLMGACQRCAQTPRRSVVCRLLEPVPYGGAFFSLLREYHGVLVPSLGDEQPRIIFDAFSQGLPVLASATDGIRTVVNDATGVLLEPGSSLALTNALLQACGDLSSLRKKGLAALHVAQTQTHEAMHATRSHELAKLL